MSDADAIARLEADLAGNDHERRRRALINLKARATRVRQDGVGDAENVPLRLVRAAGVPPRKEGLATLERLGLLEPLSSRVHKRALYTLDLLLEASGKPPREITQSDVDAFASHLVPAIAAVRRSQIRICFEHLVALGVASANPSPKVKRGRGPLPTAIDRELRRINAWHDELRSSRSTKRESCEHIYRMAHWARETGHVDLGLEERMWQEPRTLRELALWWAQPRTDGALRAEVCMDMLFKVLLRMWRAHGRATVEARDKIRALKRSLRSSGDDFGPLDLLDLRSQDPAPAPARDRCDRLAEWYAGEARRLRAQGGRVHSELVVLQRERLAFYILWKIGIRRGSLASLRFDQLKRDDEGMWYFDWCVTKRTRTPKRVVVQTWRVGDTTFSRWYVPPEFKDLLVEMVRDEGFDLERYLDTHDEHCVPWEVARDATFGPNFEGKRISPVWRGKRGHLTVGAVARLAEHIMRVRLGMARGGAHALRRRSIMDNNELARKYPQAAQAMQHLTPETRAIYEWSEERSVRHMFQAPAPGPNEIQTQPLADGSEAKQPRRKRRSARRAGLTIDDLR